MPAKRTSISLQRRYKLAALVLVAVIVALTIWSQISLHGIREQAGSSLDNRQRLLEQTHQIRNNLLIAYRSMDSYLLDPAQEQSLTEVRTMLSQSVQYGRQLHAHNWFSHKEQGVKTVELIAALEELEKNIETIITVRGDINQQYPAMAVANINMQPPRRIIDNSFLIVFSEFDNAQTIKSQPITFKQFVDLKRLWSQMLSNFRLYLANRVGSFSETSIPLQEQGIETLYAQMLEQIEVLELKVQADELSFESSAALQEIKNNISLWFDGFNKVREIHASGEWRVDNTLVKTRVIPLVDKINNQLRDLEAYIHKNVDTDVNYYSQLAQTHRYLLLFVAFVAVLLVFTIIWLSNHFVFKPLAVLANALRAESSGKNPLDIPASRILETRDLVDAFIDMRHQVRLRQNELEYRALHDGLTSLPNRALLMDHIQHDLTIAKREGQNLGLMFIDLDRFKEINDTLGHLVGDKVLIEVGNRFLANLRDSDTVARLGGDEFAILMPNTDAQGVQIIVQTILESLNEPVSINEMQLHVNASIGIALYPQHGEDAQTLMQHADVAMYEAKQNQSGSCIYNPAEDQYSVRRLALLNDLRSAIENSEFMLYYQPIVSCTSEDGFCQAEALLRWNSSKHGNIPPELVVNLAEQTGLIGQLTEWVLDSALQQTKLWRDQGVNFNVSVNLSMYNLREEDLTQKIRRALLKYDLPGHVLTLEITEGAMMFNPSFVITLLTRVSNMGIKLSIDDFGTGFSSLAYLKQLPVDQIKIDKSFIANLSNDENDQTIVKTTISLVENLGLIPIVEGVEDKVTLDLLRSFGCRYAQGIYFSGPVPADELYELLQSSSFLQPSDVD